jgi:type I restriction enzyme S subunit
MRFQPGQVLYGSRRTYLRKVAVPDFEGICANTTFVLEPSSEGLLPEFLPLVMTTERFHEHSIKKSKGSVNPYINFSDLVGYEFVLPPLEEQQVIAHLLAAAEQVRQRSDEVERLALAAIGAVISELTGQENNVKLSTVLTKLTKGTTPTSLGAPYSNSGVRFLKAENIIDGRIDREVESFIDTTTDALLSRSQLEEADVLLTIAGSIGRSAVVHQADLPANCNQAVAILRPAEILEPDFLSAWLESSDARSQIEKRMVSNTISNLSLSVIGDLDMPLPPPEAQRSVVRKVRKIRELADLAREHTSVLSRAVLRIRDQALNGRSSDVQ